MYIQLIDFLIESLFPRRCPVCHQIVVPPKHLICPKCIKKIHFIRQPVCQKCGKEVIGEGTEYCFDCIRRRRTFEYGFALARYDDVTSESMAAIKYRNKREYLDFYAAAITQRFGQRIKLMNIDVLVPIPVHPKRKRIRGFNQAEVLANKVSKNLGIPVIADGLIRIKNTDPQKQLGAGARLRNLESAFITANRENLRGLRVLLVDDIYTTGSTIEACSRVLKKADVSKIYFLTICIGSN